MKLKIFSVYDSKACFFGNPFFDQREANVIRSFADAVNSPSPENMWAKHPEDYSIFLLGEFDNETGEFKIEIPKNLITASAVRTISNGSGEQMQLKMAPDA